MAPTSKRERKQWNPKGDAEGHFNDDAENVQESASESEVNGELLRRTLSEPFEWDRDEDEYEGGHMDDGSDSGPSPLYTLPHHSLPRPPSLLPLPSDPAFDIMPLPKTDPPAAVPTLQPSFFIPPQQPATGIAGNYVSASSSADPRRTTLSAALPKSTGSGDDSDDSDDDDDDDDDEKWETDSTSSPTGSTSTQSTQSVLSFTPAMPPPRETGVADNDGQRSSVSHTQDATSSFTTSTISSIPTAETRTTVGMTTMTSIPSLDGATTMDQGREAAHTSRLGSGGEKAVIASATIGGLIILLVLAWFLWRRSSWRTSAGRRSAWPPSTPSREIFDGPWRVSSKMGEKYTSMKGAIRPSTLGWHSIDGDDDAAVDEKSAAPAAAKAGGLLARRLRISTPHQSVMVNSYGMIFRRPQRDSSLSDILLPRGQRRVSSPSTPEGAVSIPEGAVSAPVGSVERGSPPPSPEEIKIPIMQQSMQMAAAAHLENARKSVHAGTLNTPRTPRTPGTPLRRSSRLSDVSSLSSGFGDGDIVIIQPPTAAIAVKTANQSAIDSRVNVVVVRSSPERKSVSSRFSRNRDTIFANTPEDMRPRFQSISSWVGQQSRRVKQAAAGEGEDGIPSVPDILPEQGFDMMMPDGQEPRRVESSMWKKK